ncbi:uncharacterized protein SKDI_13G3040 [Saccharomyces kudriavzevii IFO 1802]|uniref:Uncharacterized protein n=1 Tax=Saccharomyces kudriavzevii (strain ATCC MYA-4449 / AS 2.2408 / CBS 8840 / NBRC 1802 / NCYC 2889) TaxID=226230 RepID=A0AA35NL58_SACK1|nr:uncharacterized protein SKDI_13G3040 [Saccharomyces kudriavzevii IFO 1802]CAI4048551.1 hypothetical protein SKDI_13G3040 [Saccharomyces kudriavzevii IFO 1802]
MLIRLSRLAHDGRRKKCCFKGTLKSFRGVLGGGGLYAEAIRNVKGNLTIFEVARLFVQHYTLLACQSKGQLVSGQNYLYNDRKNKTVFWVALPSPSKRFNKGKLHSQDTQNEYRSAKSE